MSLIPEFQIGIWNAWILQAIFLIILSVPNYLLSKEAKESAERATESIPYSKTWKIMHYTTHFAIIPFTVVYSVFLPLKLGTVWLYVGLPIYTLALVMTVMTTLNYAATPLGQPVTKGIYRFSRNPIYLSGFVLFLGMGLACASWVIILCGVLWLVLWRAVLPEEERFLLEKYGDAYSEYMKRTPKWLGVPKS